MFVMTLVSMSMVMLGVVTVRMIMPVMFVIVMMSMAFMRPIMCLFMGVVLGMIRAGCLRLRGLAVFMPVDRLHAVSIFVFCHNGPCFYENGR